MLFYVCRSMPVQSQSSKSVDDNIVFVLAIYFLQITEDNGHCRIWEAREVNQLQIYRERFLLLLLLLLLLFCLFLLYLM
jgi:hypothetical protein